MGIQADIILFLREPKVWSLLIAALYKHSTKLNGSWVEKMPFWTLIQDSSKQRFTLGAAPGVPAPNSKETPIAGSTINEPK